MTGRVELWRATNNFLILPHCDPICDSKDWIPFGKYKEEKSDWFWTRYIFVLSNKYILPSMKVLFICLLVKSNGKFFWVIHQFPEDVAKQRSYYTKHPVSTLIISQQRQKARGASKEGVSWVQVRSREKKVNWLIYSLTEILNIETV